MRVVVLSALFTTAALVACSRFGTAAQLAGVTLASLVGAASAIYVIRSPRFDRLTMAPVLALALGLRLMALLGRPILEDDHYRYLWDAFRFATDGTPYRAAPSAFFDDPAVPASFQAILSGINYPDIPTIYGPVLQALFLIGYAVAPGRVEALQGLNVVIELLTLMVLWRCGAKPRWLLLYATSPLVLKEAVMTAHPDGLAGLLMLSAFALGNRERPWAAGALMGLAIASKVSAAILLPFLLMRGGGRALTVAALTFAACYLPFLAEAASADALALMQFAQSWRFNPLLYVATEWLAGPHGGRILALGFVAAIAYALYRHDAGLGIDRPRIPAADLALGALLLFSPVVNPWYLLWLLPFAVLRPTYTAWAATFVLPLSYWNGSHWTTGQPFDVPAVVTVGELVVLALAVTLDAYRQRGSPHELRVRKCRMPAEPERVVGG